MSLRMRLFVLLGAVMAVLVVAEWWLVRTLTHDLSNEVGQVAMSVTESVVATLARDPTPRTPVPPADLEFADASHPPRIVTERVLHVREIDGRLRVVGERMTVGPEGGDDSHAASAELVLHMDAPKDAAFVKLTGPSLDQRIPIPRSGVGDALQRFLRRLFAGSAALLVVGLALAAVVAHRATAPLRRLAGAARSVGEGALGTQVATHARGEVGDAIAAFNRMSSRLAELDAQARSLREREHLSELGEIARGLAHGLRNPLNALGLSLDELAGDAADEARKVELAASARRQIRRIDGSIRSFLALASSDAAATTADVDVLGLAQGVALEALHDARGRVRVAVDPASQPARVDGIEAELRAALQAVVVNAVEASPDAGRVVIRVESPAEGGARIVVDDDGAGLPDSVRARLFTPHVTTKSSGAGMGLFLARRIVTARHGGRLELADRDGGGTRALIELEPARREVARGL